MRSTVTRSGTALALAAFVLAGSTGCASLNKTQEGAIIGAVVGGAAGAVIGRRMDQKAEEFEQKLDSAKIERVGEGILMTFESGLLFDFDSSNLRAPARANLTELAGTLNDMTDSELLISGHTDSVGGDDYNLDLSERRAKSAADYIMSRGVSGARINIVGLGETEPAACSSQRSGSEASGFPFVVIVVNPSWVCRTPIVAVAPSW